MNKRIRKKVFKRKDKQIVKLFTSLGFDLRENRYLKNDMYLCNLFGEINVYIKRSQNLDTLGMILVNEDFYNKYELHKFSYNFITVGPEGNIEKGWAGEKLTFVLNHLVNVQNNNN